MTLDKVSSILASYIARELSLNREKEEVIAYSIENMLLNILGPIVIIIIGIIFNVTFLVIMAALAGGFLRRLSGGAHLSNPFICIFSGAIAYGLIGIMAHQISSSVPIGFHAYIYIIALATSLIIVFLYAPVDSIAKPIHSPIFRKKLKLGSCLFIITLLLLVFFINTGVVLVPVALGVLFQSLTLLPFFNKEVDNYEKVDFS